MRFEERGYISIAIKEIQRLLDDNESVIIWKDEWQLNKEGDMPTNYVDDTAQSDIDKPTNA